MLMDLPAGLGRARVNAFAGLVAEIAGQPVADVLPYMASALLFADAPAQRRIG